MSSNTGMPSAMSPLRVTYGPRAMPCMSLSCAPKRTSARRHSRILIDAFLRDDPSHFYPFRAPFLHSTAAL